MLSLQTGIGLAEHGTVSVRCELELALRLAPSFTRRVGVAGAVVG